MTSLRKSVVAVAALATLTTAHAVETTLSEGTAEVVAVGGASFSDLLTFSLSTVSDITFGADSPAFSVPLGSNGALPVLPVTFTSWTLTADGRDLISDAPANSRFTSFINNLVPGTYTLSLIGNAPSGRGAYAVAFATGPVGSPIPIPESWSYLMLLAGFGMIGMVARRRQLQAA